MDAPRNATKLQNGIAIKGNFTISLSLRRTLLAMGEMVAPWMEGQSLSPHFPVQLEWTPEGQRDGQGGGRGVLGRNIR